MEKGIHRIKILGANRVELVVMALGATSRQAEKCREHGAGSLDRIAVDPLRFNRTTFAGSRAATQKAGGNFLLQRRVRQQIACQLLRAELVKWQVAVESVNHPVAICPHLPLIV